MRPHLKAATRIEAAENLGRFTALPKPHEHLDAAREEVLAFTASPRAVAPDLVQQPNERLSREIRRTAPTTWSASSPTAPRSSGSSAWFWQNSTMGLEVLAKSRLLISDTQDKEDTTIVGAISA